jgi:hypothetical protein
VKGPALVGYGYVLCHVPELVRYGSKPSREPELSAALGPLRRNWEHALAYPPHQVYIGGMTPAHLATWPRPWWQNPVPDARAHTEWGELVQQADFYKHLAEADQFDLIGRDGDVPLMDGDELIACVRRGHTVDHELRAEVLLENLAAKVTAALALRKALEMSSVTARDVEYVMSSGEEAVGDRYQRGAGNLGKAVAEMVGCSNASGADVKAFCCAPVHSLVLAALAGRGRHPRLGRRRSRRLAGKAGHEVQGSRNCGHADPRGRAGRGRLPRWPLGVEQRPSHSP